MHLFKSCFSIVTRRKHKLRRLFIIYLVALPFQHARNEEDRGSEAVCEEHVGVQGRDPGGKPDAGLRRHDHDALDAASRGRGCGASELRFRNGDFVSARLSKFQSLNLLLQEIECAFIVINK